MPCDCCSPLPRIVKDKDSRIGNVGQHQFLGCAAHLQLQCSNIQLPHFWGLGSHPLVPRAGERKRVPRRKPSEMPYPDDPEAPEPPRTSKFRGVTKHRRSGRCAAVGSGSGSGWVSCRGRVRTREAPQQGPVRPAVWAFRLKESTRTAPARGQLSRKHQGVRIDIRWSMRRTEHCSELLGDVTRYC